MAQTTMRWTCIERLVELLNEHEVFATSDDLEAHGTYPGDQAGPECVYCADVNGEMKVPVSRAEGERVTYDDKFQIMLGVDIKANGRDRAETVERCQDVVGAMVETVAMNPMLGNLDGVITARIDVPNGPLGVEFKATGFLAVAQVVVGVHARLED